CLPCGHMYGLSCIKKRLLQSSSWGKCPQCSTFCSYTDVILLYASRICASPHQRTSSGRHFPFTEEGFIEYKLNERCRHRDAKKVYPDVAKRVRRIRQQLQVAKDQQTELTSQWNGIKNCHTDALKRWADASGRHADALKRRAGAWEQHADALRVRVIEHLPRLNFFVQMFKEHQLKRKTEPCTGVPTCHKTNM
ncbi:zinc finger, RING/FYVE/PHD-type containing protein, partial [Tanacetum coccineum]